MARTQCLLLKAQSNKIKIPSDKTLTTKIHFSSTTEQTSSIQNETR